MRKIFVLLMAAFVTTSALAVTPQFWRVRTADDFLSGDIEGFAVTSRGELRPGPALKRVAAFNDPFVLTQTEAPNGDHFFGTGNDGKVYRLEETKAASAKAGAKSSWSATPYFDPGSKYIWDIVLDNSGALYVATGDHGEIYKVGANGQHSLFFKSDEVHIRALALDPKGNLIAGSDGSGLVYRIAPNGEAFVLYSAPKKEITALAIDGAGNIYAAAAGEKRPRGTTPGMGIALSTPAQTSPAPGGTLNAPAASTTPTSPFPSPGLGATGGSEIYRIAPDGARS